jgi:S-adenosyl-L-methionine hydrolase (adenosine-forming)
VRSVCFYSDYGVTDEFAGTCRAVIARIAPGVPVVDITHGIRHHDVLVGALAVRDSLPYTPERAVHLAVVDPGVGGERRAVALRSADDRLFVGPDNGLLALAVEAAGGIVDAVELTCQDLWLTPVSRTFHGRDVFAPVAARLAGGLSLGAAGEPLEPATLVRLTPPAPERRDDGIHVVVLQVDAFGNAGLAFDAGQMAGEFAGVVELEARGRTAFARVGGTFVGVGAGELVLYGDSSGRAAIAVNRGSAATLLGLVPGDVVRLRQVGGAGLP